MSNTYKIIFANKMINRALEDKNYTIASKYMKLLDKDITIKGLENLKDLDLSKGAIITSNHFNPLIIKFEKLI